MEQVFERDIKEYGLLLTQYDTNGFLGEEEFKQLIIDKEAEPTVEDYNEWLQSKHDDEYWFDSLEELLDTYFSNSSPIDVARAVQFGDVNWNDEYFSLDAYGNIQSKTTSEVEKEMNKYNSFKEWYYEKFMEDEIEEEEKEAIIEEGNRLIKNGY